MNILSNKKKRKKLKKLKIIRVKNENAAKKKINLGIEFLRMILSFLIILVHNFNPNRTKIQSFPIKNLPYYVPFFMLISFYFSFNSLASRNTEKIKQRLIRILFPYMGWPIIFWLHINRYNIFKGKVKIKNLYYQLLIGCGIYGVMWFLFNLLFISLFFTIIVFFFKKYFLIVLFIIEIFCYSFHYSKYNKKFWNQFNKIPVHHSIAPIPKNFLFSSTGFFLASENILNKYYKHRILVIFLSGSFLFIMLYRNYIHKINHIYKGIIIDLTGISAFSLFSMIPFDKLNNKKIIFILKQITSYTGGVYYLHPKVAELFSVYSKYIRRRQFKGCIQLYLISYFICFIGTNTFRKWSIKFLFN